MPAAAFRGFANGSSSASSRSRLIAAKRDRGRYTSPRASSSLGTSAPTSSSGIARIARAFGVTSSPRTPSPRVTARASLPDS